MSGKIFNGFQSSTSAEASSDQLENSDISIHIDGGTGNPVLKYKTSGGSVNSVQIQNVPAPEARESLVSFTPQVLASNPINPLGGAVAPILTWTNELATLDFSASNQVNFCCPVPISQDTSLPINANLYFFVTVDPSIVEFTMNMVVNPTGSSIISTFAPDPRVFTQGHSIGGGLITNQLYKLSYSFVGTNAQDGDVLSFSLIRSSPGGTVVKFLAMELFFYRFI